MDNQYSQTQSSEARQALFTTLYRQAFPTVAAYLSRRGGSFEDTRDIFQEALIIYYEEVLSQQSRFIKNESAYLLGISRHLWLRRCRKALPTKSVEGKWVERYEQSEKRYASYQKVLKLLASAGQKCMEVLKAFYYDKLPLSSIAQSFGYRGTRSATVQKYKCIEKIRSVVKEKSLQYADFLE
ncbi:hypothetical protein PZB74_10585 [Porifericola rhodea]|uniref:RNA polymerase sigma factor n=1 Tax=Porifericola rhodea TaxID=930972 RepID=UPI002666716F|nr:hypothetical protein [Porifericola rhodea]WKN33770.1 hypothetical protein PZB74_10585 [Porifericola rhodea]